MSHTLFVCTSCGSNHRTKRAVSTSGSERLLEQLQALYQDSPPPDFSISFGNLFIEDKSLEVIAAIACASQYQAKSDSPIAYIKCPKLLKKRVLAKISPMPQKPSVFKA